jgi:hypothetical protein
MYDIDLTIVSVKTMFYHPLEGRTTGESIFVTLKFFIANKMSWNNCVDVCTDGAPATIDMKNGLLAHTGTSE